MTDAEVIAVKRRIAVQLVNIYYDTSYKWFSWRTRNRRIKEFIDELWREYGPADDDDDDYTADG